MSPTTSARALAGAAVSAVALAALAFPGAASASVTVDCAADNTALLAAAETAVVDAQADRLAANRPLGLLLRPERRETLAEFQADLDAVRVLEAQAREDDLTAEELDAVLEALGLLAAELEHAIRLLEETTALRAGIEAGRADATAALEAAQVALAELEAALDACTVVEDGESKTVAIP